MPVRRQDWLLAQLPVGMLEDEFFRRFTSIFQEVATSYLEVADGIDHLADVTVAPTPLVPWLGSWIGVRSIDPSLPEALQRRIVRRSAEVLAWRGTRRGLVGFLELLSGGEVEVEESGGVHREGEGPTGPPIVRMRVRSTGWVPEPDFVAMVREELPAHVAFELHVGDRRVWPPPAVEEGVVAAVRVVRPAPEPERDHS